MKNGKRSLTKRYKREIIIDDVMQQVAKGRFCPGERILPIRDLCEEYGLSLRVVSEALAEMVERGILIRKTNIGYFVSDAAPGICTKDATTTGRGSTANTALNGGALDRFLSPLSASTNTITVFVSDILPQRMAVWQELADEFAREHGFVVDILSCHAGHPEEVMRTRKVDIVDIERKILLSRAAEFIPMTDMGLAGLSDDDLFPSVQAWLRAHAPAPGVPHTLSIQYLYTNTELAEAAGMAATPASLEEYFAQSAAFEHRHPGTDLFGTVPLSLGENMLIAGAVTVRDGRWALDPERLERLIRAFVQARPRGISCIGADSTVDLFTEGKMLYLPHSSYLPPFFKKYKRLQWNAHPIPCAPGGATYASMLCLAIRRQAADPDACLSLIRHFSTVEAQRRFASIGGNIPVRPSAAFSDTGVAPMPESELRTAVEQAHLLWPGGMDGDLFLRQCQRLMAPLQALTMQPEEAVRRVQFLIDQEPTS